MALFLNEMRFNHKVQTSARDSRIIRNLMEFFKHQRRHYKALAEDSLAAEQAAKARSGSSSTGGMPSPTESKPNGGVHPFRQVPDQGNEAAVERLDVSRVRRETDPASVKTTKSDISDTIHASLPPKGRLRASTLAGPLAPSASSGEVTQPTVSTS